MKLREQKADLAVDGVRGGDDFWGAGANLQGWWKCSVSWLQWWLCDCVYQNSQNCTPEGCLLLYLRCQSLSCSDSVRPHRLEPTRLPRPWDSPDKNTGVGCHFLLQCMKVKSESEVAQSCPTLSDPVDCSPPGSSVHGLFQARVLEWGAVAFSVWATRGSHLYCM